MNSEENKALVRQLLEEFDRNWGKTVDTVDKWFHDDAKMHFNGLTMDLATYKEMLPGLFAAVSDLRHEVHFMLADGDFVTSVVTIHAKHIGEWEGIAATGRTVTFADMSVIHMRDGKVAEEWFVTDLAGLRQQLEAPSEESE